MRATLLFTLVGFASAGSTYVPGTSLALKWLSAPSAVCNDGTPGGYYWSRGSDPGLWVIYLQGGVYGRLPTRLF